MNFDKLPRKNEYKFKEITSLTGVKPYVLRFWESEFIQISPAIDEAGQKLYSNQDLEYVKQIKDLLFTEKLSIPNAKAQLDASLQEAKLEIEKSKAQTPVATTIINEEVALVAESESEVYSGVEMREAIGSIIMQHSDSLSEQKQMLKTEIEQHKENILKKQFNDKDVLRLVQTKKKLNVVLGKIENIINQHNW